MLKIVTAAAAVLTLAPAAGAQSPIGQRVDAIFAPFAASDRPGCAVAAAERGRTSFSRAYGSADLEHAVANSPATIFEAGSVAKQFTAAAILMLAEDGRLSLADDVRRYLPELPGYPQTITIAQLLSHTSGLRDWGSVAEIGGWPRGTRALGNADVLAIVARQRGLNYEPGAEYSYTNSGYNLLALVVERVSGRSLAAFTRERIFAPLGMHSTSWRDDFRRVVPGRAIAYSRREEGWAQEMPFEDAYGNGGLLTTVGDLLLWNEALANGRLGPFVTAELQRRATLNDGTPIAYARGLVVGRYGNVDEIGHSGATGGYRAWLARYPARSLSIALLCNAGNADAASLGHRVAEEMLGLAPPPIPQAVTVDAARFAGLWVNERTGFPVRLEAAPGGLRLVDGPQLETQSQTRFLTGPGTLDFIAPDRMRFTFRDGGDVLYRRAQPWTPSRDELAALEEVYRSDEADAAYRARVEDGVLTLRNLARPGIVVRLRPVYRDAFEHDGGIVRFQRGASGRAYSLSFGNPRVRDLRFERQNSVGDNDVAAAVNTALADADRSLLRLDRCSSGSEARRHRLRPLLARTERVVQRARNLLGERLLREGWRAEEGLACDEASFRSYLADARRQLDEAERLMTLAVRP